MIIAWLALAACNDRSNSLFSEARRAMEADNYEAAARLYLEITIQAPDSQLAGRGALRARTNLLPSAPRRRRRQRHPRQVLDDYPDSSVDIEARRLLARAVRGGPPRASEGGEVVPYALTEGSRRGRPPSDLARDRALPLSHGRVDASANAYRLALGLPYLRDTDSAYMRLANLEWLGGSADESPRSCGSWRAHQRRGLSS